MKRVLQSIIRRGVRTSQGECPGEESCSKYTHVSEEEQKDICNHCPQGISGLEEVFNIEGSESVLPFIRHLLWLEQMKRVGAVFGIDTLTKMEWDGLILIEQTRSEVEFEQVKRERERINLKNLAGARKGRHPG